MPLRRVDCVDIYCVGFRGCLDIWLKLLGLLMLILSSVILIVFDSHSVVRHFVG